MIDATIAFALDAARVDADTRARLLPVLDRLQRELVAQLSAGNLSITERRRMNKALADARALIAEYYDQAAGILSATTDGLAPVAASAAVAALESMLPPGMSAAGLTDAYAAALAGNAIIQGATQADWWARQEADTAWRFATALRQGLAAGETNQQIIARIVGRAGFPGVMEISRANAAALVQTSVQTVANDARLATFDRNLDLIMKYRWLTALDGRVCPRCAARADLTWKADTHAAIGHSIAWANPPIHFNDRCVIIPETKTWAELGINLPEPPPGMRASRDGPVPASTTFAQFLERKGPAFADEVLGKGRADLWRGGKITLQDLVSGNGNPLSLAQLQAKYAG